ncbi:MAG: flagellar protein FlaG [Clostridia bacterium]
MRIDSNAQGMQTSTNAQKSEAVVKTVIERPKQKVQAADSFSEFVHKPVQELTMDEQHWIRLMERANKAIVGANKTFEYSIHEQTKEIMIKVKDRDTNEVLVEIPSEKILNMVAKMWEMAGLLVDERR